MIHPERLVAKLPVTLLCLGLSLALTAITPAGEIAEVPADGRIVLKDYGYRDWGPELVHYKVDTARWVMDKTVLLDEAGRAVPFQIEDGTLSFVTAVAKGTAATYQLQAADHDRSAENSSLRVTADDNGVEIANEHLALRLPAVGEQILSPPAAADSVPPPLLQWRQGAGEWMGTARFSSQRQIASYRFSIVRQGPACVEYEARYHFEPGGPYVLRVRLSPGLPVAQITEEFDFGDLTDGSDWLLLDLHAGWVPDRIGMVPGANEQLLPTTRVSDFASYVNGKRQGGASEAPVGGVGAPPRPESPEAGLWPLEDHVPAGKWGGKQGDVQVWSGDGNEPGDGRNIGITLRHAGSWRRANALHTWHHEQRGLVVSLPLGVRPMRWSIDIADDFSPFSTHEHDDGLSATYGRREWGLYVGDGIHTAQARYGYIGLDRYKNWLVEWPDTAGARSYPGGFYHPEHVARIKASLDTHPDADFLRTWYLFSGQTEDAVRHAKAVIEGLKKPYQENDFYLVGLSNYRKSQMLTFAHLAEDALACPELPAELRTELRQRLALYAYVTSDPDFNPRGSGVHLGNNNMTINRTLALTYFAGLLPDHPMTPYWLERARAYAEFKFATQTAPCGAWVACPSYQLYSPTRTLNITQNVLRNRGVTELAEKGWHGKTLEYLAHLTMPDPRFDGKRIIPGMGNSSNQVENIWGVAVSSLAHHDPELAGWFAWLNRLTSGGAIEKSPNAHDSRTPHPLFYLPDLPEQARTPGSTVIPGYGMIFRNHFGTPEEVGMLFRTGIAWSHWDTDSFNVILYGHGAPLSPGTGYQYIGNPMTQDTRIYHNRVKVGERDAQIIFGRVDAALADYGLGESVDYAVGDHYYPPELFKGELGEMHWRRHVLFLKGRNAAEQADYFVMRDSFVGKPEAPTWWTWLNLGGAEQIAVGGQPFDPATVPQDKVVPEAEMPTRQGQELVMDSGFGASTWMWFDAPQAIRARMTATYVRQDGLPGKETKTLIEIPGTVADGYLYVVRPLPAGGTPPTCEALAKGVVRIRDGNHVDTVFIGDEPFDYAADEVVFTGKAGAVRVQGDRVVLSLSAGSGRIGYKGHILEGHAPFEQSIALTELTAGVHPMAGGYEKRRQAVQLSDEVTVSGEGPFEAELDGETIRIRTSGRARVLHLTQPSFIVRPQYYVDGQEWMACWTDYPASGWGSYQQTWLIALSVPEGEHELTVRNMRFPDGWERPFVPLLTQER